MTNSAYINVTDIIINNNGLEEGQLIRIIFEDKPIALFRVVLDDIKATEVLTLKYLEFGSGIHNDKPRLAQKT